MLAPQGLEGMPLQSLTLVKQKVVSLAPSAGAPLTSMHIQDCYGLIDMSPLKGMPLTAIALLQCNGVRELSALQGMPLVSARFESCAVTDLSPLEGAPLTTLAVTLHADRNPS